MNVTSSYQTTQVLQHSNTQVLKYSSPQILQHSNTQVFKYLSPQVLKYCSPSTLLADILLCNLNALLIFCKNKQTIISEFHLIQYLVDTLYLHWEVAHIVGPIPCYSFTLTTLPLSDKSSPTKYEHSLTYKLAPIRGGQLLYYNKSSKSLLDRNYYFYEYLSRLSQWQ